MRKKSLKKNLIYQTLYQILITITPIITSPYLSRTLGAEKLGVYSFYYSITSYFILFAMMGINNYGTRSIAQASDKEKNKITSEIYTMQFISCIIAILGFSILFMFINSNKLIVLAMFFWLFSCLVNVDWYFFGCEEIKSTVIRNSIIKVLIVSFILIFIKNPDDLLKYTLIMSIGDFISKLVMFIKLNKSYRIKFCKFNEIKKHIKPNLILFVPLLALSIFHLTDKTMLGLFSNFEETGFYYNSDKLINIPLGIITGLGTTMLSRCSYLAKEKNIGGLLDLVSKSFDVFLFIICAISFGIATVSKEFIPLFFGNGYEKCILLTVLLSIVMILKTIQSITTNQLLIPLKKDKVFIKSVIVGAIVNIIFNSYFIIVLNLGALGAVYGTIIAELSTCLYQMVFILKNYNLGKKIFSSFIYILFGLIMFVSVNCLSIYFSYNIIINFVIKFILGTLIYISLTLLYWVITNNNNLNEIFKIIKKRSTDN